ncbi:MAG: Hint domain-containing protein [Sulfitobacter sp.]
MPVFYAYTDVIFGTQSSIGGQPVDYRYAISGTWRYSGSPTSFVVSEETGNTTFDGDPVNEAITPANQIGGSTPQTIDIGGSDRQAIWDYTFTLTRGGTTLRVGVIDVDLNNSDVIEAGSENGYFLVFPDGMPLANRNYTVGGIVENDSDTPHDGLGAETIICFAAGTLIETQNGLRAVEALQPGDMVLTRDNGYQPLRWTGSTTVQAVGDLAPIAISKGSFGTTSDLILSPQHAILIEDWRAELFFGQAEVLVKAKDLEHHNGVCRKPGGYVTYCHILFDAHQLVSAAGIWSESLYPGDMTMQAINPSVRDEINQLIPDISSYGPKAARYLRSYEAACIEV